ncbi:transcriptional regulator GutM [Chloroflexus sp.]|uniref:transcriptional regulator GutM n=1 Tax=Chloroflexus sp. TaxID=1904827 RepID=UPI00298EF03B|nr:transcriptional regulator GutM [Chloroflexus sp.]MDW8403489.1 transcriptional regulator GutM [Chloroflexus sp.]
MEYVFLLMAILWMVQFGLAWRQLRHFHCRVAELRQKGRTAVGMHGNRWRGRTYAVLTADSDGTIRSAEIFDGWTVFSHLRPVPALAGLPLSIFQASQPQQGIKPAQWAALCHAASFLAPQVPPVPERA